VSALKKGGNVFADFQGLGPGGGGFRPMRRRFFDARDFNEDALPRIFVRDGFSPGCERFFGMAAGLRKIAAILVKLRRSPMHSLLPIRQRLAKAAEIMQAGLGLGQTRPGAVIARGKTQDLARERQRCGERVSAQIVPELIAETAFLGRDRAMAAAEQRTAHNGKRGDESERTKAGKIHLAGGAGTG